MEPPFGRDASPPRKRARTSDDSSSSASPAAPAPVPDALAVPARLPRLSALSGNVGIAPFLAMSLRSRTEGARALQALAEAPGTLEAASVIEDEPMALAAQADESTTDDEELQQLSMVRLDAVEAEQHAQQAQQGGELSYDDVKLVVFSAAKDPRLATLQKSMRMIKAAVNGDEIMRRLVNDEDETGLTLLMIGVKNNLLPFCAFLLEEGADVNYNSVRGWIAGIFF